MARKHGHGPRQGAKLCIALFELNEFGERYDPKEPTGFLSLYPGEQTPFSTAFTPHDAMWFANEAAALDAARAFAGDRDLKSVEGLCPDCDALHRYEIAVVDASRRNDAD